MQHMKIISRMAAKIECLEQEIRKLKGEETEEDIANEKFVDDLVNLVFSTTK